MKTCRMCGLDKQLADFTGKSSEPDGHSRECRDCQRQYRINRAIIKQQQAAARRQQAMATSPVLRAILGSASTPIDEVDVSEPDPEELPEEPEPEPEPEEEPLDAGAFIQSPEVLATWVAVQKIAKRGGLAPNLMFKGPSGCGKTEAAKDLAARSDLPFFKIDAPAMVDPEAWFGTREVVVEDGAPKTVYIPSAFVEGIEQPCLMLLDEINRVSDAVRQILLPLFDGSRQVTNPFTGQVLKRHPLCFIVMTGNVGIAFTGTYAIDPALLTRSLITNFDYLDNKSEVRVVVARTGIPKEVASTLVRFAGDTRAKAKAEEDFQPISTREVLAAADLISEGLDPTTAVRQAVINGASEEGGADSQRATLEYIWKGIFKES